MMNRIMVNRYREGFLVALLIMAVMARTASAQSGVTFGLGGGAVWHGGVGLTDGSALGSMGTGFIEYVGDKGFGARAEATWVIFSEHSLNLPPDFNGGPFATRAPAEEAPRFVGGRLAFVWFDDEQKWARSYFLVGAGGYRVTEDGGVQVALAVGPGFGVLLGKGRPSVAMELNLQVFVFEESSLLLAPLVVLIRF